MDHLNCMWVLGMANSDPGSDSGLDISDSDSDIIFFLDPDFNPDFFTRVRV